MSRLAVLVRDEPVRVWLYGIGAAVVALLVVYGVLTPEQAGSWLAVVLAVVGVPAAAETLRSRVAPTPRAVAAPVIVANLAAGEPVGHGDPAAEPDAPRPPTDRVPGPDHRADV